MSNPYGQVVNRQASGGLSIWDYWCKLFRENELAFRSGHLIHVLDDIQIAKEMHAAFPDRQESMCMVNVKRARTAFNRGELSKGAMPLRRSFRYLRLNRLVVRVTPYGNPLDPQLRRRLRAIGALPWQQPRKEEDTNGSV